MSTPAYLDLEHVGKSFGDVSVVQGISLGAALGEFVVLVGASGCGKSTTLRMIAGLEAPTSGRITIDGRDVTRAPPARRDIAMVFQNYALYPHMDVAQNMGFALELAGVPRDRIDAKVKEAARILGIDQLLARKPRELSGGQRQRVAMGRAIVREPKVFLFDEPLSNLDAKLRGQMRVEIALLHRRLGKTTVYVTHDQVEAMTLADRIVVLDAGRIQQVGTPDEVFNRPVNQFVAGFIGSPTMNFLPVRIAPGPDALRFEGAGFGCEVPPPMRSRAGALPGGAAVLGVRPQSLRLGATTADLVLPLVVQVTEYLGTETVLACTLQGDPHTPINVVAPGRHVLPSGSTVSVGADAPSLHAFEAGGHGPSLSN